MRRSVLFSLLVIGAAIGIVAAAGSFSAFTDTSTGSTFPDGISSADLELLVDGDGIDTGDAADGAGQDIGFTFTLTDCTLEAIAPPEVCTREIVVENGGDLPFTFQVFAFSDDDGNGEDDGDPGGAGDTVDTCFNVDISIDEGSGTTIPAYTDLDAVGDPSDVSATPTNYTGGNGQLDNGETQLVRISAAVADDDSCQDNGSTIVVTVVATQAVTP